jgi:hypothetical protein
MISSFLCLLLLLCSYPVHAYEDDTVNYQGFYISSSMPSARSDMTANTFLYDHPDNLGERIYLIGGCTKDQQCLYTNEAVPSLGISCYCPEITNACTYFILSTQTWHSCAPAPRNRTRHMAAFVNDKLYVAGGRDVSASPFDLDDIIHEVDAYDPITDTWTSPFYWNNATSDGAAFAVGNLLYLVGGYDYFYSETAGYLTTIDVTTGVFNQNLPKMNVGRGDIAVASYNQVHFYVLGGWAVPNFCNASKVIEVFDSVNNTWATVSPMLYGVGDIAAGAVGKNIFSMAGETKDKNDPTCSYSKPVPNVMRYSLVTKQWNIEASIPEGIFRFVFGASLNESTARTIYLFGGQGTYDANTMSYSVKNSTLIYVPLASDFIYNPSESPMRISDGGIAGIVIGCFVFVLLCIMGAAAWIIYKRRGYSPVSAPANELASQQVVFSIEDVHDDEELGRNIQDEQVM